MNLVVEEGVTGPRVDLKLVRKTLFVEKTEIAEERFLINQQKENADFSCRRRSLSQRQQIRQWRTRTTRRRRKREKASSSTSYRAFVSRYLGEGSLLAE